MESIAGAYASDSEKGDDSPLRQVSRASGEDDSVDAVAEEPAVKRARTEQRPVVPSEPPGEADSELTIRLAQFREKGYNPTQHIRQNREFANPQLLQKIVDYFEIDDIGSCYPKHLFNPQAIVARRARDKTSEVRGDDERAPAAANSSAAS